MLVAQRIWPLAVAIALFALACGASATQITPPTATTASVSSPSPTTRPSTPTTTPIIGPAITVGNATFLVELTETPEQRTLGLSGRESLDTGTGMLFVFESDDRFSFWMRDMQFPLDFVWVGSDCSVADITENVPYPEPETDLADLPRYQPSVPVRYVLEINAGVIAVEGIELGDRVIFEGTLAGRYGC